MERLVCLFHICASKSRDFTLKKLEYTITEFIVIGLSFVPVFGQNIQATGPLIHVDVAKTYGNGVTSHQALQAALEFIKTDSSAILVLTPGIWAITDNIKTSPNISLVVKNGALIKIPEGKRFVINGPFEAGPYQVFDAKGTVTFSSRNAKEVIPQWWGAVADATSPVVGTDNCAAFTAMAASISDNMRVFIPEGKYRFNGTSATQATSVVAFIISGKNNVEIYGAGNATKLYMNFTDSQFRTGTSDPNATIFRIFNISRCTNVKIHDLYFEGQAKTTEALPKTQSCRNDCMQRNVPVMLINSTHAEIYNIAVKNVYGSGIVMWGTGGKSSYGNLHHNYFENVLGSGINVQGGTEYIKQNYNIMQDCYNGFENAANYATINNNFVEFTSSFIRMNYLGNKTSAGINSIGSHTVINNNLIKATDGNIQVGISVYPGGVMYLGDHPTISGNNISGAYFHGIRLTGSVTGFNVSGNTITSMGHSGNPTYSTYAIYIVGTSKKEPIIDGEVIGNVIFGGNNSKFGIYLSLFDNITIEDNTVTMPNSYPLYVESLSGRLQIKNNHFNRAIHVP